jgi:DNA-binding CsgD family transcriptional regulator
VDAGEPIAAIEAVHRGDYLIGPIIAARVLSEFHLVVPELPRIEPLMEGEMAVLRLVAQGMENQEIAQALNYSVYTVANRLRTLYEKLHVTNRTQAALYALRDRQAARVPAARSRHHRPGGRAPGAERLSGGAPGASAAVLALRFRHFSGLLSEVRKIPHCLEHLLSRNGIEKAQHAPQQLPELLPSELVREQDASVLPPLGGPAPGNEDEIMLVEGQQDHAVCSSVG